MGTIFLPLGFIVGYFGMNFKSMGSPSLNSGVFSIKHVEKFIAGLSLFIMIIVAVIYNLHF
jgi:Mg2+ and Co2+ transporter CorA